MDSSRAGRPPQPPPPRPYKAFSSAKASVSAASQTPPIEPEKSTDWTLGSLLWPFGRPAAEPKKNANLVAHATPVVPDRARGEEAMRRVITEGVLDRRYKPAARRVTAILVALPFAIYLSYELFQRRFLGKEQRKLGTAPKSRTLGETGSDDAK